MTQMTLFDVVTQSPAATEARVFLAVGGVPVERTRDHVRMQSFRTARVETASDCGVLGEQVGDVLADWHRTGRAVAVAAFVAGLLDRFPALQVVRTEALHAVPTLADRLARQSEALDAEQFVAVTLTPQGDHLQTQALIQLDPDLTADVVKALGQALGRWARAESPSSVDDLPARFLAGFQYGLPA
ncbi:hypothetical protein TPY_3131 [Sulfobacillus acidophilus TPY]|uniref:Uncharacterized protein n=1 Tax=Sulfobacillus acidophilus (strain ATCC 700253 / DSM 10332 / NAL) TaxID=679936 RepID=G8U000_SULAD|nr:hypothetical protein TPY_3131 [Sulfobacillus acidophilus TPY]AEW04169.1 hypothetical protein Sulac_0656 [Sulfobacillus acidophilus DSM 10332]